MPENLRVYEVMNPIARPLTLDQPDASENAQVLRHRRLSHSKTPGQRINTQCMGVALSAEQLHQLQPGRVGKGSKYSYLLLSVFFSKLFHN